MARIIEAFRKNASNPNNIAGTQNVFTSDAIKTSLAFEILLYSELKER